MADLPVDHGWAWVVCFGAFVSLFFMQGTMKSLGILLVEFIQHYQAGQGMTALIVVVVIAVWSILTPVVMALCRRFSFRQCIMTSAGFLCVSAIITAWAPNITVCIVGFGFLTGIGYACLLGPTMAVISQYFEKRISLANGIASAGGSVGQLVFPVLLTFLLKVYNLRGVLIIYGGCFLHLLVAACLMRPLTFYAGRKELHTKRKIDDVKPEAAVTNGNEDVGRAVHSQSLLENRRGSGSVAAHTSHEADTHVENDEPIAETPRGQLDCSLLCHPLFVAFCTALNLGGAGFMGFYHFLPAFCQDIGVSRDSVAMILFVCGLLDLLGHFAGGWFGDLHIMERHKIVSLCSAIVGMATICGGIFPSFAMMVAMGVAMGFLGGVMLALWVVLLRDAVGPARFPAALGLSILFRGVLTAPAPFLFGKMRDVTGSYRATFCVCGAFMLVCSSLVMLHPCLYRWTVRLEADKQETSEANDPEDKL